GDGGARLLLVPAHHVVQPGPVGVVERPDGVEVAGVDVVAVQVDDVGDTAGHARREVAAGLAEDDRVTAGHVLAAVVAHALGDDERPGVADAEPLADLAAQEHLAAGGTVGEGVAGDDAVLGEVVGAAVGTDNDPAAGQALADVVVGVALQPEGDTARDEGAEGLAGRAGEGDVDGVVGQTGAAELPGHLVAEHGADRAVDVADGDPGAH